MGSQSSSPIHSNGCDPRVRSDIDAKLFTDDSTSLEYSDDDLRQCFCSISEIRTAAATGTVSIASLVKQFHFRKQQIRNSNFALTDVFFANPLLRATELDQRLDALREQTLKDLPLFGCIMSLKDSVQYKGSSCTQGFMKGYGRLYSESAGLVDYLESKGAVVVCKGNVPQALMAAESNNFVFGNVSNPFDACRSAGGSSGGEAANLATHVVNCAIGSDIAGSLRIPALFCGVYSLKPTAGRFASCEPCYSSTWKEAGQRTLGDAQMLILPTCGPMACTAVDVERLARVMNEYSALSLEAVPLPWIDTPVVRKIGVLVAFSSIMEPCIATERALTEAVHALELETIPIDLSDIIEELVLLSIACFLRDETVSRLVKGRIASGERLINAYDEFVKLLSLPVFLVRIIKHFNLVPFRECIYIRAYILSLDKNTDYFLEHKDKLHAEVISRFRAADVDVCLGLGLFPALTKGTSKDCDLQCLYVFVWNFLNFPVGAVPITTVRVEEQHYESRFDDKISKTLLRNMAGSAGLPVGVQVIGLPWHEEKVLRVMVAIESGLATARKHDSTGDVADV